MEAHRTTPPAAIDQLGEPARDGSGRPTMAQGEVTALVRRHLELEKVRSGDYDTELWAMWQHEVARADDDDHNADVLDRVLARIRAGE
jgi:hypothetical protein